MLEAGGAEAGAAAGRGGGAVELLGKDGRLFLFFRE